MKDTRISLLHPRWHAMFTTPTVVYELVSWLAIQNYNAERYHRTTVCANINFQHLSVALKENNV